MFLHAVLEQGMMFKKYILWVDHDHTVLQWVPTSLAKYTDSSGKLLCNSTWL